MNPPASDECQPPAPQAYAANGSNGRFDFTAEVPAASSLGSVHFIAIGGAGMSGVARVMLARGLSVSGSDAKKSLVLAALASEGALVHIGHDAAHLGNADTVVISSAIREDNVELQEARSRGLRVLHRSQALASVMQGSRRVAVAGANGKTTTTSMLVVALQQCGVDPSFAVGGELAKHGTNAHHGTGEIFVAEADESDGSFLVYRPEVAIVTNVQPDHLDFYGTFVAIQAAYAKFATTLQLGGLLVTCVDDYGHNPGKVAAVVETALVLAAPGRLIVVFQPHLYSRTRDFAAELATALSPADIIIVMDVYAAREDPMPGVSGSLITDQLADAVQPS